MSTYRAVRYQAASPDAQFLGIVLVAFISNLRAEVIAPIVEKYGIRLESFDPAQYYDMQNILYVLRDIEAAFTYEELVAVGVKAGQIFELPPEINNIETAVMSAGMAYNLIMARNVPAEETIIPEQIGPKHYRLTYNLPSPPYPAYGQLFGVLRRVRKPDEHFTIKIVDYDATPYEFIVTW